MPRSCRLGWSRCVSWIIFSLIATSLSFAQSHTPGKFPDPPILFYGGDFDPNNPNAGGLANETDAFAQGSPYGAAIFQNFVISGKAWNVTGLFTNNLSSLNPSSGYWEIRIGVSEGNGGTLIAAGTANGTDFTHTPTGRSGFGLSEFTDMVSGLNLCLAPRTYWFAVVPEDPQGQGRSFNGNTFGLNSIGTQNSDHQFWNFGFFGANYTNTDNEGVFPTFSSGVIGNANGCGTETNVDLTVTPPDPTAGQVVTLTATVTAMGNVVDSGTVSFLSGTQTLGTVQVVKTTGMATLLMRFAPGSYTLTARYNGTNSFLQGTSSPQPLSVSGTEPTISALTATPNGNNYDFDLSVFGFGFPPLAGSAAVTNLTQNELIGNIDLAGPGAPSLLALNSVNLNAAVPGGVAVADFDQDGFPDLAITDKSTNQVLILLGIGDGTFQPFTTVSAGNFPNRIATGDFNDDGIPDLAVTNPSGTVTVLLGQGGGIFSPVTLQTGGTPDAITVGDFDGDGELDLAITDSANLLVLVYLGSGTGQFQKVAQSSPIDIAPDAMAAADFNADGLTDLVVANRAKNTVTILLGQGNGTFQAPKTFSTGAQPTGVAVADFTSDNIPDLAVSNQASNTMSILKGDGQGNFTLTSSPQVGLGLIAVAAADMNDDGIPDLVVANQGNNTVGVLLGNGDGTFQGLQTTPIAKPQALAVADFNGDSVPDPVTANFANGGSASVFLGGATSTGQLINVPVHGTGVQDVQSTFTPNGNIYASSDSNVLMLQGNGQNASMTMLSSDHNPSTYGQLVTFTATVSGVGGIPTGTVGFTADGNVIAGCSAAPLVPGQNSSTAICKTAILSAGMHTIVATYSGDSNFQPSTSLPLDQQVNPATPVITVTPYNVIYDVQPHTATATATCGGVDVHTDVNLSGTTHTNAGDYPQDAWTFHDPNGNCADANGTVHDVIGQAPTTTIISPNPPNGSQYGQLVTFTATITGANGGNPTGTLDFDDDQQPIAGCTGTQVVSTSSMGACQTSSLSVGCHNISASYSGDGNFLASFGSIDYCVTAANTAVTLTVNPPDPTAGQVVTLSAMVTSVGNVVSGGTVSFLSGTQTLGTVQVVKASGIATLLTRFGPGSYTLTARYNGTNQFGTSVSSPQPLSVTGMEPTITTLAAQPDGSNFDFFAEVYGFGFPLPTGTATVNNVTQGGTNLGTIELEDLGVSAFLPQPPSNAGSDPSVVKVADFNGDGFADVAVANYCCTNTVSVLLGGDGGLNDGQPYQVGSGPFEMATADFNGDGFVDLAICNQNSSEISVLLGNGDGTFQPQQVHSVGKAPSGIAAGDFNGDGIPDLVVSNQLDGTVSVLLGNGDGTFQPQKTYQVGVEPLGVATADFNGDGIADLAVVSSFDNAVNVLLGNGDGTFQPQHPYLVGSGPQEIVIADFNQDGSPDLAVANSNDGTVSVLLGNGDGTFQPQHTYPAGTNVSGGITTADFNGDGIPDLAVGTFGNTVNVLMGNADGSFQAPQPYQIHPAGRGAAFIASGDFNGDGVPDLAAANAGTNTVSVILGATMTFGDLFNVPVIGTNQTIQSTYTPNTDFYTGSLSNDVVVNPQIPTTMALTSSQNPSQFGQPVTFTATVTANGGGSPTGTVNFTADGNALCSAVPLTSLGGGSSMATCSSAVLSAGIHSIVATYSGDEQFAPSTSQPLVQLVNRAASSLAITANPPSPSVFGQPVTFTATASGSNGGSPTGTVNFTADNMAIAGCTGLALTQQQSGSTATCQTASLPVGSHTISTAYGGDGNFGPSTASISYTVGAAAADFTVLPISPASVTVTQGFSNNNDPFFAQTINVTVQPMPGYVNTVTLSCSVSPPLTGGSCVVNPPSSGSLATGNLSTTLTISAGNSTPIGPYTVTVTAQDTNQLVHTATLALTVIDQSPMGTMQSGGAIMMPVNFPGNPNTPVGSFACTSVTGTGISGSEDLSLIGGVCTFNPSSINLPSPVTVTISGCTVALLQRRTTPIFASFLFGLPGLVLLGPLFRGRRKRRNTMRVVTLLLLTLALTFCISCGGGGYGPLTPAGHYYVLVQGSGPGATTYSAVVPLTVTK